MQAGVHVVLTAHAQMRKFEQPDEMGAYDRYEMKLGKKTGSQISPLVKEWADMVLFANYKTLTVQTDDKGQKFKAQGGKRVMYTSHHPCWDAKNRFGLADELPFEYAQIAHCIGGSATDTDRHSRTDAADERRIGRDTDRRSVQHSVLRAESACRPHAPGARDRRGNSNGNRAEGLLSRRHADLEL